LASITTTRIAFEKSRVYRLAGHLRWAASPNGCRPDSHRGVFALASCPSGREFSRAEERLGTTVVILSEALDRQFGRDRAILNRSLVINGEAHTVIGVAPNGFQFGTDARI
jgi:hypothetical protein